MREEDKGIIRVDGSYGEGGGQILRTSLTLSCLTGRALEIFNIRAGRKSPGLKPQHLLSAGAARAVTNGTLAGASIGATGLLFSPGPPSPGAFTFDVAEERGSAGSTGLVFQTVVLPLSYAGAPSRVVIKGGTHVEWSPPADYIRDVFLHTAGRMGLRARIEVPVAGFYPVGGGELDIFIDPADTPLKPINITERGDLERALIRSAVANLPESIALRQFKRAEGALRSLGIRPEGDVSTVESPGRGTFLFILLEFENIRAGFSALGRIGKKAEEVADEASEAAKKYLSLKGALDPHLADQMVLPMALAEGASYITTTEITQHLTTNIHVIEKFLPVKFSIDGTPGNEGTITVIGPAFASPRRLENIGGDFL